MRASDVAFRADAEKFALHGVDFIFLGEFFGENGVERFDQPFAGCNAVDRQVFVAVGNPDVRHARGSEGAADVRTDLAAAAGVLDPEIADVFVAVGEGEAVRRFGMGKAGRIEVHADAERFGPIDPRLEVLRFDGIPVDFCSAVLEVERVQVQSVFAWHEGKNFFEVRAQLARRAGASGVIARDGQAAARIAGRRGLESANVIALPAVDGDRGVSEDLKGLCRIDTHGGIRLARQIVGGRHRDVL